MGPHLWSQSAARRSIRGHEPTHNPSPAAASILGKRQVARGERALKRAGKKRAHKANPIPAMIAATLLPQLKARFNALIGRGPDAAKQVIRLQRIHDMATLAMQDTPAGQSAYADLAGIANREEMHGVAINDATVQAAAAAVEAIRTAILSGASMPALPASPYVALGQTINPQVGIVAGATGAGAPQPLEGYAPLVGAAVRALKPHRSRYPAYRDRNGRDRYSYKEPGSRMRLPAGATPLVAAGAAAPLYSFFQGAIGAGGAATTIAQVGVGAAAGAGAYMVTSLLLQYLGGRAQTAQEAGVNAARAHREALLRYPDQKAQINQAYFAKLGELGYDPQTFQYKRSGLQHFLETYNPLGG